MEETPIRLVHYFDTESHRIVCGVRGFEQRSTKHARAVTCLACVKILADRAGAARHSAAGSELPAVDEAP